MSPTNDTSRPAKRQFTLRRLLMVVYILCLLMALAVQEEVLLALFVFSVGMLAFVFFCLATNQNKTAIISTTLLAFGVFFLLAASFSGIILDQSACLLNAKQIGLALHNYNDRHSSLPPRIHNNAGGEPGLSWRVGILPFVESGSLYNRFEVDEPWDSASNLPLTKERPHIYRCPAGKQRDETISYYYAAGGPDSCFPEDDVISLNDIAKADGTSNTLLVVESHDVTAVWSEPRDLDAKAMSGQVNQGQGVSGPHPGGATVCLADGSIRHLSKMIDPEVLKQLANRRDGKPSPGWEDQK